MNASQVKSAFTAAGIKVRVADHGGRFRICRIVRPGVDVAHDKVRSCAVAAALGLRGTSGQLGGQFNQAHEMVAYTPACLAVTFGLIV